MPKQLFGDLDIGHLLNRARAKSGLTDLGDEWILDPLSVLIDSINKEAELHALGKIIQARRIEDALVAHLRVRDYLARQPEALETQIDRVIVIAGLQRTGTTTLQRLIASHERVRAMRAWEAMNPVPILRTADEDRVMRIKHAQRAERMLKILSPDFFAVHPVEYDAPEEDVLLLDHCFMSTSWEALLHVPSYAKWLESQDHARAYAYLRDLLKVMLPGRGETHWVIKSPHHAEYLDLILKLFPEALVVMTHRDPLVATPSFFSMVAHGRGLSSDAVNPQALASHWLAKIERLMRRSMAVRQGANADRFIDVSYYDLLKDPMHELERVYAQAGLDFDNNARNTAEATAKANTQYRYGRHRYALSPFGLTRDDLEHRLGFYRRAFAIPYE